MVVVRLRQEGKLALLHEVKLYKHGTGGAEIVLLRQEYKLVLPHEVKLCWRKFYCFVSQNTST